MEGKQLHSWRSGEAGVSLMIRRSKARSALSPPFHRIHAPGFDIKFTECF